MRNYSITHQKKDLDKNIILIFNNLQILNKKITTNRIVLKKSVFLPF